MELIISLVATLVLVLLLRKPIKNYAIVFYIAAIAVDVLFLSGVLFGVTRDVAVVGYPYVVRCLVGFSLFAIVMFVGAFGDGNRIRRMLMPIRGELSVLACILTFGHVANYLRAYLDDILGGFFGMSVAMIASLVVSTILIILLVPLAITSLETVKNRMHSSSWKKLQKSAYAFFALTYIHIVLMLAPTVSSTGQRAVLSMVVYTAVFALYFVLRVRKAVCDKRATASRCASQATSELETL